MKLIRTKWSAVMDIIIIGILVSLLVFIFSSCKHTLDGDMIPSTPADTAGNTGNNNGGNNGNNSNLIPCNSDTVYFNNTILPLLVSNCAKSGCHDAASAQDGIILDSYSNIMASGEITPGDPSEGDIMEVITENDPDDIMPPPGNMPLTQQQVNQIAQWISQGAKNNYCNECDTTNVTYTSKIKALMDLKCKGCHNASSAPNGINLSTYTGVVAAGQSGELLGAVQHQPSYSPMPKGTAQLPLCEIDMISIWIQNQYPQ